MTETVFTHAGLSCKAVLTSMGHWCGYVGIPDTHPWFGLSYTETVSVPKEIVDRPIDINKVGAINLLCASLKLEDMAAGEIDMVLAVDVHGGLTFAQAGKDDGLWWLGFDCAHCDDGKHPGDPNYRDEAYVIAECKSLADQLASFLAHRGERT